MLLPLGNGLSAQSLIRKYKNSTQGLARAEQALLALNQVIDRPTLLQWKDQATEAQEARIRDPSAMDIFDLNLDKGRVSIYCNNGINRL
jgi:hypothetical protein